MPWVRFTAPFNFQVKTSPHVVISYKVGSTHLVKQACADQAIKAGKAVPAERREDNGDAAGR